MIETVILDTGSEVMRVTYALDKPPIPGKQDIGRLRLDAWSGDHRAHQNHRLARANQLELR